MAPITYTGSMTSILFTTGPEAEVRLNAERLLDGTYDIEEDDSFPGFDLAIDLFAEVDAELLASQLENALGRPVRTLESLDR